MAGTEAVYLFHSFRVDPARRLLLRGASPVSVTAKVFDLLMVLIRGRERVITRDELIEQLWPDTTVEDGNLSVGISTLRKALGSGPADAPIIETLPRVGYRFVAEVREESGRCAARRHDGCDVGVSANGDARSGSPSARQGALPGHRRRGTPGTPFSRAR